MYISFTFKGSIELSVISTIVVLIDNYVIDLKCKFMNDLARIDILTIPGNQKIIEQIVRKYAGPINLVSVC